MVGMALQAPRALALSLLIVAQVRSIIADSVGTGDCAAGDEGHVARDTLMEGVSALQLHEDRLSSPRPVRDAEHEGERSASVEATSNTTAVQRHAQKVVSAVKEAVACQGAWCDMLLDFAALFDTGDAALIQQGVDKHTEWPGGEGGIRMALTRHYYYEIRHDEVQSLLAWLLPKGLISWTTGTTFYRVDLPNRGPGVVTIARNGTFSMHLNYFLRKLFWSSYVVALPEGQNFPYSEVTTFQNCDNCPAIALFDVKEGGLTNDPDKGWKVVGITIIKLA